MLRAPASPALYLLLPRPFRTAAVSHAVRYAVCRVRAVRVRYACCAVVRWGGPASPSRSFRSAAAALAARPRPVPVKAKVVHSCCGIGGEHSGMGVTGIRH
jgi:hypothetical protein